jgi:hypothetical protein
MLDIALALAEVYGFSVIPVDRSKRPVFPWKPYQRCVTSPCSLELPCCCQPVGDENSKGCEAESSLLGEYLQLDETQRFMESWTDGNTNQGIIRSSKATGHTTRHSTRTAGIAGHKESAQALEPGAKRGLGVKPDTKQGIILTSHATDHLTCPIIRTRAAGIAGNDPAQVLEPGAKPGSGVKPFTQQGIIRTSHATDHLTCPIIRTRAAGIAENDPAQVLELTPNCNWLVQ